MEQTISTKSRLLILLAEARDAGVPVSGALLARELGISRNAVWKAVHALQDDGHDIGSSQSKGYILHSSEDILSTDAITASLDHGDVSVTVLDTVVSTNSYARDLDTQDHPCVVISDEQTGGRGRYGRSFFSPKGSGLYLSYAFKPDFPLDEMTQITAVTAVLVRRVLSEVSCDPLLIKWVNDIYCDGRKVVGILTEGVGSLETASFDKLIIGIGINCFSSELPSELRSTAGFLSASSSPGFTRTDIASKIINALDDTFRGSSSIHGGHYIDEYREYCLSIGKRVTVNRRGAEPYDANAIGVSDRFELIIRPVSGPIRGRDTMLSGGEASLKFTD